MRLVVRVLVLTLNLLTLTTGCAFASSANVYIAESGAGIGDGSSCANARALSFFNTASNWGAGTTQIGPGTTVHVCGMITASLTTRGAGTSGSVITILFEPGAKMSSPIWSSSTGAIQVNNAYIVVDGGTNGIVENTANGTGMANHGDSKGIVIEAGNVTVQNLAINNIYVHTYLSSDTAGGNTYAIYNDNQNNVTVSQLTIHDVKWGIFWNCNGSTVCYGFTIQNSTVYNFDHGVAGGDNGSNSTLTNWIVRNNNFYDMVIWDTPTGAFHHNHVHVWQTYSGSSVAIMVYNNYFHGNWGASPTASITNEQNVSATVYNNLIVDAGTGGAPYGCISAAQGSPLLVVNNTCITTGGVGLNFLGGGSQLTVENNIISGATLAINVNGSYTGPVAIDNNNWFGSNNWAWPGAANVSFASWQAACKCDSHSLTINPSLNLSTFQPNAGSPAIQNGANLTGLNYSSLNSDKNGVMRPSGVCSSWPGPACWDIGALQNSGGGTGLLLPPTGIAKTIE